MSRSLIVLVLFSVSAQLHAAECKLREPEEFPIFLRHFSDDKQFAVARTSYPVRSIKWEFGANEKGEDESRPVRSYVSKQQNAKAPSLGAYIGENGLTARTKSVSKRNAEVEVFKPSTDWIVIFRFKRKGNCWFFTEYEDQSL